MNLKGLIKEVEYLIDFKKLPMSKEHSDIKLDGIKQTVEAVDNCKPYFKYPNWKNSEDWQKLKKLLNIK